MKVYADNAATTKISRHALDAMHPGFEFHPGKSAAARKGEDGLLDAAQLRIGNIHRLK